MTNRTVIAGLALALRSDSDKLEVPKWLEGAWLPWHAGSPRADDSDIRPTTTPTVETQEQCNSNNNTGGNSLWLVWTAWFPNRSNHFSVESGVFILTGGPQQVESWTEYLSSFFIRLRTDGLGLLGPTIAIFAQQQHPQ